MKQHYSTAKLLLLTILLCGAACTQAQADINTDHIFLLSPNHDTATHDYYSYSPTGSAREVTYFLVLFGSLDTAIDTLTVKLSSSPVFKSYDGSVTYSLFAVGYPTSIFCAKTEKATYSTVSSNYITAKFPVASQYGVALIGAALVERHETASDVKMSLKVSVD